ncbi:MAG: hypothetical protein ACT4O1_12845, partial [Gemmatimonadota bacterium]
MKANKIIRIAGISAIAAMGALSVGFAPSFSTTKDMGRASASPNPMAGQRLYVDQESNARRQADSWRTKRADDARAIDIIAQQPQAFWINEWAGDPNRAVKSIVQKVG